MRTCLCLGAVGGASRWFDVCVACTPVLSVRLRPLQVGNSLYIIGGASRDGTHYSDVHAYDLSPRVWSGPLECSGTRPPAVSGHAAVCVGDEVLVFGGMDVVEGTIHNTLFALCTRSLVWRKPKVTGQLPDHRNAHAMVARGATVYLFGGSSPDTGPMNDFYVLQCGTAGMSSAVCLAWCARRVASRGVTFAHVVVQLPATGYGRKWGRVDLRRSRESCTPCGVLSPRCRCVQAPLLLLVATARARRRQRLR